MQRFTLQYNVLGRVPGSVRLSVDIDDWFLAEVGPVDDLLISVLLHDGFENLVEARKGGLASAKHWEARHLQNKQSLFSVLRIKLLNKILAFFIKMQFNAKLTY